MTTNSSVKSTRLLALIFGALTALVLASCGVGLEDSVGPNPDRIIKNQKNEREYQAIKGVYVGEAGNASTGLEPFPAKFSLYFDRVKDGVDSDMQDSYRIVLRGRFQRLDFVGDSDNLILSGSYDAASGLLNLEPTNASSSSSPGGSSGGPTAKSCDIESRAAISIRGRVIGDFVSLVISRDGRIWARFEAALQTKDVTHQADTDADENLERLREMYRKVQGTYAGGLMRTGDNGTSTNETVKLSFMIVETREGSDNSGEPCFRPRLNGRFMRDKVGEFDDVSFSDVRFFPDRGELKARWPGDASRPPLELRASLRNGVVEGELFTVDGAWGQVSLRRQSTTPTSPSDEEQIERERLLRTYSEVIGAYRGKVVPEDMTSPYPVELVINIIEQEVGKTPSGQPKFLPALRARYRRLDMTVGGDRVLVVRYTIEAGKKQLYMINNGPIASPVPGAGTLSITAVFDDQAQAIRGQASDHRGAMGQITITRVKN